jgi:predicted ester cyclase
MFGQQRPMGCTAPAVDRSELAKLNPARKPSFMGIPATGRKIRFDVHARGRFVDGKMAERWDRADFEDIKRQLTGPTQ